MGPAAARILRRDFPLSEQGYDRTAVDAHLAAVAATLERPDGGSDQPAADAEFALIAGAHLLLGQISLMRTELQRLSAALLAQSQTIGEALEALEAGNSASTPKAVSADLDPGPAGQPVEPPATAADPDAPPVDTTSPPSVVPPALTDARLVALDMALGGSDRDEIGGELARRFGLPEPYALADEVLAALG